MIGRIRLIQSLVYIAFFAVWLKLGYWQVIKSADFRRLASSQYTDRIEIEAARGKIFSSDGSLLVANINKFSVFVDPKIFKPPVPAWDKILSLIPASASARANSTRLIDNPEFRWTLLSKNVSLENKRQIETLSLPGIFFIPDAVRNYPEGSTSAYLTGFVADNGQGERQGYFGLEGYYDRQLRGRNGWLVQESDVFNSPILGGGEDSYPVVPGWDLVTGIDRTVQYLALKHLSAGLDKYQADAGSVSIIESKTGSVLAMVSLPGYDPANFSGYSTSVFKNPIISDAYEPGSTFKPIIMASALDAGAVTPDTVCTACTGPVIVGDAQVRSWNNAYYPDSTMPEIILHSDNVGMVFVSRKLGKAKMLSYIRKFRFGVKTGIDLQEEDSPELRPDNQWFDIDWATAAFGQGIAATRLQMLLAINVLANKGWYIFPRVVTQLQSPAAKQSVPVKKPVRIISEKAASDTVRMMINGVENGEVRYYKPKGFLIAGKTGTAQVPISGHYDPDESVASFVGFAPADNPVFTMLVTLKNPKTSPWGSTTAAPLWFGIASDLFRYYRLPPNY
jgi:cell division protein FtsI/penicillin-binding protein 2